MHAALLQALVLSLLASQLFFRSESRRAILRILFPARHDYRLYRYHNTSTISLPIQVGTRVLFAKVSGRTAGGPTSERNNWANATRIHAHESSDGYSYPRTTTIPNLDDYNTATGAMLERLRRKHDTVSPLIQEPNIHIDNFTAEKPEIAVLLPKVSPECEVPIHAQPTCNAAHEIDLRHSSSIGSLHRIHFGGTRNVWRVVEDRNAQEMQTNYTISFALKTLRWKRQFSPQMFSLQQREAVALNYLSNTPGVVGMYGYCATTLMGEYANRDTLSAFLKRSASREYPINPIQLVQIAWRLARAVANIQEKKASYMGGGYDDNVELQVIHRDLDASNILLTRNHEDGGSWDVRLDDWNMAYVLQRSCTYQDRFVCGEDGRRPDARAPEECRGDEELSNKIDTHSLGTVLFYLLTHRRVYNLDAGAPGPAANENVEWYRARVKRGGSPQLPQSIESDSDEAIIAVVEAMQMCMESDPMKRSTAREVANLLLQRFREYIAALSEARKRASSRRADDQGIYHALAYFPRVLALSNNGQANRPMLQRKRQTSRVDTDKRQPPVHVRLKSHANMKKKKKNSDKCEPYAKWSLNSYPTCNSMHEMDFQGGVVNYSSTKVLGIGASSLAWALRDGSSERIVVLRDQRFDQELVAAAFSWQNTDAVILEKLSSSPHIMDIYGHCGVSSINEFANGGDFFMFLSRYHKHLSSEQKLSFAADALAGMSHIHSIDSADMATVMQRDVSFSNMAVVSEGETVGEGKWKLKLHDFNMARFLHWNFQHNRTCGWGQQSFSCNGKWKRTPEDCMNTSTLPLDYPRERRDVYTLGTLLFFLLNGEHPYSFEANRTLPDEEYLRSKPARYYYPTKVDANQLIQWLREGKVPSFSKEVKESQDPAIIAIRKAVRQAMNPDIYRRPSAISIANYLKDKRREEAEKNNASCTLKPCTVDSSKIKINHNSYDS